MSFSVWALSNIKANKMVKKVKATKVVKSKPNQQSKKPKGKVVQVAEFEDLNNTALEKANSAKNLAETLKSTQSIVETEKLTKAISELKKFIERSSEGEADKLQLFDDEEANNVELVLSQTKLFTTKKNFKQKLITITGKPQPETKPTVALFVRDNIIDKELLEKIESSELNGLVSEIITGAELKTTYKQFEKRRELIKKYDVFVADDGLVTTLPKLLGKVFYESSKIPISIRVSDKLSIESATNQINKVLNSFVYQLPRSNNLTIQLGNINTLNEAVLHQVINHFSEETLSAIFIKSAKSPALPLYEVATVYTEADVKSDEPEQKQIDTEKVHVDGVEEDLDITAYEKGLIELANPSEIPALLQSKIKKSKKQAKIAEKKARKQVEAAAPVAKKASKVSKPVDEKKASKPVAKKADKVSKPTSKKKKTTKA
jgi:proteasome-interacting protein CIC1